MTKLFINTKTWVLVLLSLMFMGCSSSPARYTPPLGPGPQDVFVVERDYKTTWNALLRALDQMPDADVWYKAIEEGKITLRDTEVPVFGNCQCGNVGDNPLRGLVVRNTSIDVGQEAPQITRVRIHCSYTLPFSWPNVYGRSAMKQEIECVSTGRFERELYERAAKFLYPQ